MVLHPRATLAYLCLLLASCTDPTAFRLTGPYKHIELDGRLGSVKHLDFTVYNIQAVRDSCWQLLDDAALGAVRSDDETGIYQVTFTDGTTKQTILSQKMRVDPDLLFQHEQPVRID